MSDQPISDTNIVNDVQVIRNILLGESIEKFQQRIEILEKEINNLQKENRSLRRMLEAENEKHSQALIAHSGKLETTLAQITSNHKESVESLRKAFDSKYSEFSKRLSMHESQQDGLMASLAEVLLGNQKQSGK